MWAFLQEVVRNQASLSLCQPLVEKITKSHVDFSILSPEPILGSAVVCEGCRDGQDRVVNANKTRNCGRRKSLFEYDKHVTVL